MGKGAHFFFESSGAFRIGLSGFALLFVLALAFLGVRAALSFVSGESFSASLETSPEGNRPFEIAATSLVEPGALQEERRVPGEKDIEASDAEVYRYANLLAKGNGFRLIGRRNGAGLKNPDLVFPGDTLRLPDGRLARVKPGQYIWEIAKTHYRRDMARLQILVRRVRSLKRKTESEESLLEIQKLKKAMIRLAVTPRMKQLIE